MSAFVGKANNKKEGEIKGMGFWPGVNVAEFREEMRIYTSIEDGRILNELEFAFIDVTDYLDTYAQNKEREGYTTLAELPNARRQMMLFKRAIFAKAKQNLISGHLDVDLTRKAGADTRESVNDSSLFYNAMYNEALRMFLDQPGDYVGIV